MNIDLPVNISLPLLLVFYLTDITIPVSYDTIESSRNNNQKFTIGDPHYYCRSNPDGNCNTITLYQVIVTTMSTAYPQTNGAYPTKFTSKPDNKNNNIMILNSDDQFQILTDTQALSLYFIETSPMI